VKKYSSHDTVPVKEPKHEILVAEFFTQNKLVWVDDLGTGKKLIFEMFGMIYMLLYFKGRW
jgi:hypothetical protein